MSHPEQLVSVREPNPHPILVAHLRAECDGGRGEFDGFIPAECEGDGWQPVLNKDGSVTWTVIAHRTVQILTTSQRLTRANRLLTELLAMAEVRLVREAEGATAAVALCDPDQPGRYLELRNHNVHVRRGDHELSLDKLTAQDRVYVARAWRSLVDAVIQERTSLSERMEQACNELAAILARPESE